MISAKCGYSQSTFRLDEKTGLTTAREIEADDQETVRTIKTIRDALKNTMDQLIYACNAMEDNTGATPSSEYEVTYDWGDITYNYDEDRAMWMGYVDRGWARPQDFLVKFEGMTEEEADELVKKARETMAAGQGLSLSEIVPEE